MEKSPSSKVTGAGIMEKNQKQTLFSEKSLIFELFRLNLMREWVKGY